MSDHEYSQGICGDGVAILKDGQPMTIEEIVDELQKGQAARAQGACEWAEQLDACEFHGNDHEACAEYSGQVPCARAQSGQGVEPVAWYLPGEGGCDSQFRDHATVNSCTGNPWAGWQPLYTHPPGRPAGCAGGMA
jgi:hypothetical protein